MHRCGPTMHYIYFCICIYTCILYIFCVLCILCLFVYKNNNHRSCLPYLSLFICMYACAFVLYLIVYLSRCTVIYIQTPPIVIYIHVCALACVCVCVCVFVSHGTDGKALDHRTRIDWIPSMHVRWSNACVCECGCFCPRCHR